MKSLITILLSISCIAFMLQSCTDNVPVYKDPNIITEKRVDDLLKRMSLDEKLAQIGHSSKSSGTGFLGFMNNNFDAQGCAEEYNRIQHFQVDSTRLGIPAIREGEGIFAYMGNGSTSFPQSIGIAATWDPIAMAEMANALGLELRSRGIRNVLAPVVNLARDSRWGRTGETYGEDPYMIGIMGAAYCRAMDSLGLICMPKHFAANMGLDGKFASQVHFTERYLREIYFPGFKACFQEGKAKSIMMAYNSIDGIPCHANKWLMTEVLRKEWGFDGYISSDGGSLDLTYNALGISANKKELVARSINAGCDLGDFNEEPLRDALKDGLVSEKTINESVRRVLRQKFRIGLFENPYVDPILAKKENNSQEHRAIALEIAKKSMVLLKNDNNTLPFSKNVKKVAVIGPLGDWLLINHYGGWGRHEVTVLEGIKKLLPQAQVSFVRGAEVAYMGLPAIKAENFIGGLKGEYFDNPNLLGKPKYIQTDAKIEFDWKEKSPAGLPADNFSIRWSGKLKSPVTGKYMIGCTADDGFRLMINGDTLINDFHNNAKHLTQKQIVLEKGKIYDIKLEYFDSYHTAYVQLGWDVEPYGNIAEAVKAALNADVVIAVVGMRDDENQDRAALELDPVQEKLIESIAATGKPMAVVIQTGTVIAMNNWIEKTPSVLQAWYPGCEGGNAIAQTLFGDYNPGGKLPITFPKVTGQVPINYNHYPYKPFDSYIGVGNDPLFAFGHGLSYTSFTLGNFKLSKNEIKSDESMKVSVDVTNTGNIGGDEVVQLYIHDELASVVRPVMELKDFKRISLKAGETRQVTFTLTPEKLKIWDINMKWLIEPGDFKIMVGNASNAIKFTEKLTVIK